MRLTWILCLLLAACTVLASNWGKDDYEVRPSQARTRSMAPVPISLHSSHSSCEAACDAQANSLLHAPFYTQIFELQAALRAAEGDNATFYSLLGIDRKASAAEIKKAYRKKSMELQ